MIAGRAFGRVGGAGRWLRLASLFACICAAAPSWPAPSAAQVAVPPLTGHVIDQSGTLTAEQKAALEQTLTAFEARKGSQLAVLLVASTAPEEVEQYALRVAEQWKLGRKKIDDGAILVMAKNDRAMRIEVGYGLEGVLGDLTSKRIISETILPLFKGQDFYGGVTAGVEQVIRVVDGERIPAPSARANPGSGDMGAVQPYAPMLFILALAVGGVLRATLGKVPGALTTGGVVAACDRAVLATARLGHPTQHGRADLPVAGGQGCGDRCRARDSREGGCADVEQGLPADGSRVQASELRGRCGKRRAGRNAAFEAALPFRRARQE